jgi:hypothetical protein
MLVAAIGVLCIAAADADAAESMISCRNEQCSRTSHHRIIVIIESSSNDHRIIMGVIIESSWVSSSKHHHRIIMGVTIESSNHHRIIIIESSSSNHHRIIMGVIIESSSNHHRIIMGVIMGVIIESSNHHGCHRRWCRPLLLLLLFLHSAMCSRPAVIGRANYACLYSPEFCPRQAAHPTGRPHAGVWQPPGCLPRWYASSSCCCIVCAPRLTHRIRVERPAIVGAFGRVHHFRRH